jgi:AraC-like DNA-binding protein
MATLKEFRLKDAVGTSPFLFHIGKACVRENFPEHVHDFSELVVILGGTGVHTIDGTKHFAKAGDVDVIGPKVVHGFSEAKNLAMCNISYSAELFAALRSDVRTIPGFQSLFVLGPGCPGRARGHAAPRPSVLAIHELAVAGAMIDEMAEEYAAKREGYESLIVGCFLKLVVYLSRNYQPAQGETSSSLLKLATAMSFIEQRFAEPLSLPQVAEASGLSPRHLSRLFEENYKTSPMEYIVRTRLEQAARLLRRGDRSVTDIAFETGYNDSNYFSRSFRSAFGMSPSEYRKAVREG